VTLTMLVILSFGFGLGVFVGWLASRPAQERLRTELEKDRAVHAERLKAYSEVDVKLREAFQALSADALRTNNEAFLTLAESRLREARAVATSDMDTRKRAIEELLAPMAKTLEQVDREIREAERQRIESGTHLIEKMAALDSAGQELRGQTARLVDALKRPSVRGRWGELQLKRVVELAGMVEHCDFTQQRTLERLTESVGAPQNGGGPGRIRPDIIVQLPGGKHVVVDAKVPLDAYLRALEVQDEESRQRLLAEHARQVRTHVSQLAAKNYGAQVPASPDFVVMFLPGEMLFSAALEHDPTLIEFGVERRVILASPTTLIALLRVVAFGWQQQAMEENARKISDLGKNLYEAIRTLGGHFETLGTKLKASLDSYNMAVGSLESNVLVKARKLKELQAANGAEEIRTLEPIDRVPRMPQAAELTGGLPFSVADQIEHLENAEPIGNQEHLTEAATAAADPV
jgi:DNA recombination protein RmuC